MDMIFSRKMLFAGMGFIVLIAVLIRAMQQPEKNLD